MLNKTEARISESERPEGSHRVRLPSGHLSSHEETPEETHPHTRTND